MEYELRSDGSVRLTGYVNAVERDSRQLRRGGRRFVERVAAGTFKRALKKTNDIKLSFNHGRVIGGLGDNLTLKEDNIGLYADALVDDAEVVAAARKGSLTGWSFRFYADADEWSNGENGVPHRRLTDITLEEVSILNVTPAYNATSVEVRDSGGEDRLLEERNTAKEMADEPEESPSAGYGAGAIWAANDMYRKIVELLKLKAN